jgi:hypothetical protein
MWRKKVFVKQRNAITGAVRLSVGRIRETSWRDSLADENEYLAR